MLYYINSKYTGVENIVGLSSEKTRCQVILEKTTKEKIEKLAKEQDRSLSNMINFILKEFIKQQEDQ